MKNLAVVCVTLILAGAATAQPPTTTKSFGVQIPEEAAKATAGGMSDTFIGWSSVINGALAGACGLGLAFMVAWMAIRDKLTNDQAFRAIGIVSIGTLGSILIASGFSLAQMSPMMAIFGTVIGYFCGRDSDRTK